MHDEFQGPHFAPDLIGPDGKLSRLHKGAAPPPPVKTPPPVRETSRDVQQASLDERAAARRRNGYGRTLLGGAAPEDMTGKKTLLG